MQLNVWISQHAMPTGLRSDEPVELEDAVLCDNWVEGLGPDGTWTYIPWSAIRFADRVGD
jgi:hypothetical protein